MIISASRRTDIPAFYTPWLMERLRTGSVCVRNPFRPRQVSLVSLKPEDVDCIVFWTKNPAPLMPHLAEIEEMGFTFYFQFSLTPYDRTIERSVPDRKVLVQTFRELAERVGAQRVVWRYDPIILSAELSVDRHVQLFAELAAELRGSCERCMISFLDFYAKTKRNAKELELLPISEQDMQLLGQNLSAAAKACGIRVFTCCEQADLSRWGIGHGKCVDDELIGSITGRPLASAKDRNQRPACGCVKSVDIGAYDTCLHQCLYCYANADHAKAAANWNDHDPRSPLLHGWVTPDDELVFRKEKKRLGSLFTECSS